MIVGPIVVKSPGKQASAVGVAQAINLGSFADPNAASSWTETIDWGDNTSSTLHLPPGSLGKLNHTYAKKGTRTVTVTVTDNLGVTASYSFTVSVSAKNNGPNSSPAVSSAALGAGLGTSTSNASAISNNGAGALTASATPATLGTVPPADVFDLALSQVTVKKNKVSV